MELHQTWTQYVSYLGKVPYCFWEVKVKGQGHQRSKGQKLWSDISLIGQFHFRSKSSLEVKGQIHIFGHNSKTIGRIDLKPRPLDSSRWAAQKCCSYFSSYDASFLRYSLFCVFFWTVVFRPNDIFDHNSKTIGRGDLKQEALDCSRRAAQKWYRSISVRCTVFEIFALFWVFLDFLGVCRNFTLSYHFDNVITQRILLGIIRIYLLT